MGRAWAAGRRDIFLCWKLSLLYPISPFVDCIVGAGGLCLIFSFWLFAVSYGLYMDFGVVRLIKHRHEWEGMQGGITRLRLGYVSG